MCCLSDTRRPQNLNKCVYMEKLIPRGRRTFHLSIYEQLSELDTDMAQNTDSYRVALTDTDLDTDGP